MHVWFALTGVTQGIVPPWQSSSVNCPSHIHAHVSHTWVDVQYRTVIQSGHTSLGRIGHDRLSASAPARCVFPDVRGNNTSTSGYSKARLDPCKPTRGSGDPLLHLGPTVQSRFVGHASTLLQLIFSLSMITGAIRVGRAPSWHPKWLQLNCFFFKYIFIITNETSAWNNQDERTGEQKGK